MFKKILLVLAVIIAGVIIWLAVIDGNYHVKRSVVIHTSVEKAYNAVSDYKTWPTWSPWLIMENNVSVSYVGEPKTLDHGYTWKGNLVGSGEMTTTKLLTNELIEQGLFFKEPFPSESQVYWTFNGDTSKVEVTWGMKGSMPFFFKFMAKQMEPMIGMDYERGLNMFKELLETGKVSSKVNVLGVNQTEAIAYIGIKKTLTFNEMEDFMNEAFMTLMAIVESDDNIDYAGSPLTIYHEWGLDGGPLDITVAVPISGKFDAKDDIITGEIPAGKSLQVQHLGKYENTGNAWATAFSYSRYNKLKVNNKADGYEYYTTNPMEEPDSDKWETIVCLPVK